MIRRLPRGLPGPFGRWPTPLACAGCAILAGCGLLPRNEDEGKLEPLQEDTPVYQVSVSPISVELSLANPVSQPLTLTGSCFPTPCPSHDPQWNFRGELSVLIANPHSNTTAATIQLGEGQYLNSITGDAFWLVAFDPKPPKDPSGKQIPIIGRSFVDVQIRSALPPLREDTPADPSLTIGPSYLHLAPQERSKPLVVRYKGPETIILDIIKGGENPGDFSFSAPATPFGIKNGATFTIVVNWLGSTAASTTITVTAEKIATDALCRGLP